MRKVWNDRKNKLKDVLSRIKHVNWVVYSIQGSLRKTCNRNATKLIIIITEKV